MCLRYFNASITISQVDYFHSYSNSEWNAVYSSATTSTTGHVKLYFLFWCVNAVAYMHLTRHVEISTLLALFLNFQHISLRIWNGEVSDEKGEKTHFWGTLSLILLHVNWKYVLSIWNVSVSELKKLLLLLLVLLPLLLPLLLLQQRLNRQRTFVFVLYLIQQHIFCRFYSIYIYTHTCTAMAAWMDGCTQLWMHFFHTLIIIVVYTFLGLRKKK